MSLQFNNRRRRRKLKRKVIITIRVLLTVLVLGLIVYGSVNVYSYLNNKNKENVQEEDNIDELPTEPDTDKNPEDDTDKNPEDDTDKNPEDTNSNSNSSGNILDNNNNKDDEVLDNTGNTEQDKGNGESGTDTNKSENDKPENNETNNNEPNNNETENGQTSNSDSKDESYFDDAVFIGDSRTEGLKLYSGLKNATFYAEKGLDVATIFTHKIKINGSDMTIIDALHKKKFGKVYINLGINEMGWPYDSEFIKHYGKVIDAIKEAQPDAVIYLQSIIRISSEKDKNPPEYFKNKTIIRRNKLLKELAKEKDINYIDPNEVLTNDKGYLIEGASFDGVHLNKAYCEKWKKFLIDNIVK
jgi:hypothetical protein